MTSSFQSDVSKILATLRLRLFIICFFILVAITGLVIGAWRVGGIQRFVKERGVRSRLFESEVPGYLKENIGEGNGEQGAVFKVSDNPMENIDRVVDNVSVRVKTFSTAEEAQNNIEEAGLVYIWEWRSETLGGREVHTGYLRDQTGKRYEAAYLAWREDSTYFELIARPVEIRDYSDKEFLYQSAREVAESLITQ